jgi:ribosomal protein S11
LRISRGVCIPKKRFLADKGGFSSFIGTEKSCLKSKNFFGKQLVFKRLRGLNIFFINKIGKNLFVIWLDTFGRIKQIKSLMTLRDPKKQKAKKQKSFSAFFLLKKFGRVLRKRYRILRVALLFKGSLGIRRKKSFTSGIVHSGFKISALVDITNIPFNGCRLKKKKRL